MDYEEILTNLRALNGTDVNIHSSTFEDTEGWIVDIAFAPEGEPIEGISIPSPLEHMFGKVTKHDPSDPDQQHTIHITVWNPDLNKAAKRAFETFTAAYTASLSSIE